MGKALYRAYRPTSLDEVVGQEHITDTLKNALKKGAISHAYLFTGPKGVGKTSIARILAHEINQLDYSDESIHLDIIEIDAASNRRIDEIREIRDKVNIAPSSATYKVYIIDEVHMLTREAFNALLKTLEEPPAHVVFILATTEAHKVPDTIMSRTQKFTFKPVSREKVVKHLASIAKKEHISIEESALEMLADHGNGSFRDSISMLDQLAGIKHDADINVQDVAQLLGVPQKQQLDMVIKALSQHNIPALFESVQTLKEQGIDSGKAAQALSKTLREMLITDDTTVIEHTRLVMLLKSLLPLTTGSQDFIGLELALVEIIATRSPLQQTKIEPTTSSDNTVALPEKQQGIHDTTSEVESVATVRENSTEDSEDSSNQNVQNNHDKVEITEFDETSWKNLLHALKQKHNTLYGVLRMAKAIEENGRIVLEFGFAFHKKQVDSPKNTTIVKEYISRHFGIKDFETKVGRKTTIEQPTPAVKPEPKSDIITSVSNIFGGAELLES